MRRKAKIREIIAEIDKKIHDVTDPLIRDALYSYRDTLVQEFYDASTTIKPKPKQEPI